MSGNSKALASKLCLASAKKFQYVLTNSTLPDYCVGKDMSKEEMNEFLPEFFKFLQEQGVKDKNLSGELLEEKLKEYSQKSIGMDTSDDRFDNNDSVVLGHIDAIQVINADEKPYFSYNLSRKIFEAEDRKSTSLFSDVQQKVELFRDRYKIIYQRVLRDKDFNPTDPNAISLTSIESLLGSRGTRYIMGMITKKSGNIYQVEDLNGVVQVDVTNATTNERGMIVEGCFVIISGVFDSVTKVFKASAIILPPFEEREQSEKFLSTGRATMLDMFGPSTPETLQKLKNKEELSKDAFIVVVSDVCLDKPNVFEKLGLLFDYFKWNQHNRVSGDRYELIPAIFLFIGNFISRPFQFYTTGSSSSSAATSDRVQYQKNFEKLAKMIEERFPNYIHTSKETENAPLFVFVPGPNDPTLSPNGVLPKSSVLSNISKAFKSKVPNSIFTTNPCRIRFYTHEIVIFRQDLQQQMRRHAIEVNKNEESSKPMYQSISEIVLSQSHLTPFALHVQPIFWAQDHSLNLFPSPHSLILSDRCQPFKTNVGGCLCFNPPSFPVDFSFEIFSPLSYNEQGIPFAETHTLPNLSEDH
ncbi:hypothetical protein FDP41_005776 [Naegleria fowleri]|uniref:DNA polymerase II subunit 2 n=1 Tax=Naegleria fowleri TaxID=5763 RepID=A0A6A5BAE9_NAEFO|nr:uncharacterized protein FDP41_005776 [Naegleria fowleri]KAF0975023.1 hypothetical protein FDP41_005776 [Naegleria fowleri]